MPASVRRRDFILPPLVLTTEIDDDDTTIEANALADWPEVIDGEAEIGVTADRDRIIGEPEGMVVTAHASSATTATVRREVYGAARTHPVGTVVRGSVQPSEDIQRPWDAEMLRATAQAFVDFHDSLGVPSALTPFGSGLTFVQRGMVYGGTGVAGYYLPFGGSDVVRVKLGAALTFPGFNQGIGIVLGDDDDNWALFGLYAEDDGAGTKRGAYLVVVFEDDGATFVAAPFADRDHLTFPALCELRIYPSALNEVYFSVSPDGNAETGLASWATVDLSSYLSGLTRVGVGVSSLVVAADFHYLLVE